MSNETQIISRNKASNGQTEYITPIVVQENSATRVDLITHFIKQKEIAISLKTYKKNNNPVFVLNEKPEKSVSLDHNGVISLLDGLLKVVKIADMGETGRYVVHRLDNPNGAALPFDDEITKLFESLLNNSDAINSLNRLNLNNELLLAMKSIARIREMESALVELTSYLDDGNIKESVYQSWCEKHAWVFGNYYAMNDHKVRSISENQEVDLLVRNTVSGFQDVIELKTPEPKVLVYDNSRNFYYFSAPVSQVIAQCHNYLDTLHRYSQKLAEKHPEMMFYHPKAIVVVGRSNDWDKAKLKALHGLNSRLHGITIMTFDQLVGLGNRLLEILKNGSSESSQDDQNTNDLWEF
jgi:hypothetical protein